MDTAKNVNTATRKGTEARATGLSFLRRPCGMSPLSIRTSRERRLQDLTRSPGVGARILWADLTGEALMMPVGQNLGPLNTTEGRGTGAKESGFAGMVK